MSSTDSALPTPKVLKTLGPGLITGAADDDPSGIATYSQAGAQFGLNMLWTVVLTYPLMVAIQSISARSRVSTFSVSSRSRFCTSVRYEAYPAVSASAEGSLSWLTASTSCQASRRCSSASS